MPDISKKLRNFHPTFLYLALVGLFTYHVGSIPFLERTPRDASERQAGNSASDTLAPVKLLFAGDCTLTWHFEDFVGERFDYPFLLLEWFGQADISMVNLENPITTSTVKARKMFNYKMNPKYLTLLRIAGIDVVSLANNHIYDYGDRGLLDTIHFLDSVGIKHVGAGRNLLEARKPAVFEVRGLRVGYLAYFGTGTFSASDKRPGVAPRFENLVVEDIQNLKEKMRVNYAVVNFHWGKEKAVYPARWQVKLAHAAVLAGADLVVGHHPHVVQGIERYKSAVIAYSLGNFLFGGNSRRTYDTALLQVELRPNSRHVSIIPIRVKDWQPFALSGAEAQKVLRTIQKLSQKFPKSIF